MKGAGFVVLSICVIASAIAVVQARHASRLAFAELERMRTASTALEVEYGRLLLEQETLANHARIERIARERSGLAAPAQVGVLWVKDGER